MNQTLTMPACLAQLSLFLRPQTATRLLKHPITMVSSLAPPRVRLRAQGLLPVKEPIPQGQGGEGRPWNNERSWDPAPSLMCP